MKKTNKAPVFNIATIEAYSKNLEEIMQAHSNVSLHRLAQATNINYSLLLSASKKPTVGKEYDPTAINYTEVAKKFVRKGIVLEELDWEELDSTAKRKESFIVKDTDSYQVGMRVYLRKDNETPYEIVYRTETHVVLQKENTSEPIAWSFNTFLLSGPSFNKRITSNNNNEESAQ